MGRDDNSDLPGTKYVQLAEQIQQLRRKRDDRDCELNRAPLRNKACYRNAYRDGINGQYGGAHAPITTLQKGINDVDGLYEQ